MVFREVPCQDIEPTVGASAIECCYAATGIRLSSPRTDLAEQTNTHMTFFHTKRIVVDEKTSLNVSRRFVRPAWMAGVLTSRPNFNAR